MPTDLGAALAARDEAALRGGQADATMLLSCLALTLAHVALALSCPAVAQALALVGRS